MKSLSLALWGLLTAGALVGAQPAFPQSGKQPADLVPKGWQLLGSATGHLNSDGRPDAVLVLASQAEDQDTPPETWVNQPPRRLVLALGAPDGLLHVSATSDTAVLGKHEGGVFGDPFEHVAIANHLAVIAHYGGSRNRWSIEERYRHGRRGWLLQLATRTNTDNLDPSYEVIRRDDYQRMRVNVTRRAGTTRSRQTFLELWATRMVAMPTSVYAWPLPTTRLDDPAHVTSNRAQWKDPRDLGGLLKAIAVGPWLYLHARVADDLVTPQDAVVLVDGQGQPVPPDSPKRAPLLRGYEFSARYPLAKLGLARAETRLKAYNEEGDLANRDRVLHASLELHDADKPNDPVTVMSTSQGGRSYPANIRLRAKGGYLAVEDANPAYANPEATDGRMDDP